MLKRLYTRFLLWSLAPVLESLRVDEQGVIKSIRVECANPKTLQADSGMWALDAKGTFSLRKAS